MARTTMATSDALRKQAWEAELWRDTLVGSYFLKKFASEDTSNFVKGANWKGSIYNGSPEGIIHVKADLGAKGTRRTVLGDKINFGIIPRIDPTTNVGVTSGQTLKGKEVSLSWYSDSLTLERYRQAVSAGNNMDWNRASFDMPAESRNALKTWGSEKLDLLCFQALEDSTTSPTYFYKTADSPIAVSKTTTLATAKTALSASLSKVTPEFLDYLKTWCLTGGARASGQIPPRPIMVDGKPFYVFLTYPDALFDWRNDSTAMQAMREAEVRGKDNPLFAGADYVWNGMIIHTHEFVTTGTDGGGASVPWCYAHVLGAQSLFVAMGEQPSVVSDTEDYEEDLFYAWRVTTKIKAPVFNSLRYGSVSALISRTNVSGT